MRSTWILPALALAAAAAAAQDSRPAGPEPAPQADRPAATALMEYATGFEAVAQHVTHFAMAALAEAPAETLVAQPDYGRAKVRYGVLTLGDGPDNRFTVALAERPADDGQIVRQLYVDANNDQNLTNDGEPEWSAVVPPPREAFYRAVTFRVPYRTDDQGVQGVVTRRYPARLLYSPRRPAEIFAFRDGYLHAKVQLGATVLKVALLDENTDGLYSDLEHVGLLVDTNGDGRFDPRPGAGEMVRGDLGFWVGEQGFRLSAVTRDGQLADFAETWRGLPPKKGRTVADFSFTGLTAKPSRLADLRGKVVLVAFWATWCPPCRLEEPALVRVYRKLRDKGFEILAVSFDGPAYKTDETAVREFLARQGITWPVSYQGTSFGENPLGRLYRVSAVPSYFLLDRRGVFRYDRRDFIEPQADGGWVIEPKLTAAIEQLLAAPK